MTEFFTVLTSNPKRRRYEKLVRNNISPIRTTVISNWRPRNTVLDSVWTIGNDAVLAVMLNLNDFDPQMTKNGFATYFSNRFYISYSTTDWFGYY